MEFDDRIRAAFDRAIDEVRAAAATQMDEVRQAAELSALARHDSASRLSDCVKAIDSASSLGAVLSMVSGYARLETGRGAVMIVRNRQLFDYPARTKASDTSTARWRAIETRTPVVEGDTAIFPISLGGQVAAILCAAAPLSPQPFTTLDLLVRHAGRALEAMTVFRITGLAPLSSRTRDTSVGTAP